MAKSEARLALEAQVEQERMEELSELAARIVREVDGRLIVDLSHYIIFLWDINHTYCVGTVSSDDGWQNMIRFAKAMNTHGERELQQMEYDSQESVESRRNGYGVE